MHRVWRHCRCLNDICEDSFVLSLTNTCVTSPGEGKGWSDSSRGLPHVGNKLNAQAGPPDCLNADVLNACKIILSVVLYGCEAWSLTLREEYTG